MNADRPVRQLPADRYHGGVRAVALLLWFAAIVLVYLALRLLADLIIGGAAGVGVVVLVVLAVILAQPLAYWLERLLVQRWPSGRAVHLEPGALVWRDRTAAATFDLGQTVNYWRWRFVVKRRRGGRVPVGHHLLAVRLTQGETEVSLYAFLPPAAAEALAARYNFYELRRPTEPGQASLGGRDAIYLSAEEARWAEGAELEPADFEALLGHLAAQTPDFGQAAAGALRA